MKKIVCEMCGSSEFLKEGDFFVCQNCGCKYTVEDARKIMVEITGPVEVHGKVSIDKQKELSNYLNIMNSCYDGEEYDKVVDYAEKIIEIDPNNARAWILKGLDSAYLDPTNTSAFDASYTALKKGIQLLSEDDKKEYQEEISKIIYGIYQTRIIFIDDIYLDYPCDDDRSSDSIAVMDKYFATLSKGIKENILILDENQIISEAYAYYLAIIGKARSWALKEFGIYPFNDYNNRNHFNFEHFMNTYLHNISILFNLSHYVNLKEQYIKIKETINKFHSDRIDAKCYDSDTVWQLNEESINIANQNNLKMNQSIDEKIDEINKIEQEKAEKEREIQLEKNNKYWIEHKDLKEKYETDISAKTKIIESIQSQIISLRDEIKKLNNNKFSDLDLENEIKETKKELNDKNEQLEKLGIFKMSLKKQLNEEISNLRVSLRKIEDNYNSKKGDFEAQNNKDINQLNEQINVKNKEICDIQKEITSITNILNANY